MPCSDPEHTHIWNTEGELTIERCENYCGFCGKKFNFGWFTRRHVRTVHQREYPNLTVSDGWSSSPSGNRKARSSPEKRGRRYSTLSTDRSRSMSSGGSSLAFEYATPSSQGNDVFSQVNDVLPYANSTSFNNLMPVPEDFINSSTNFNMSFESNSNLILGDMLTTTTTSNSHELTNTFDTGTCFVTPQRARTSGEAIDSIMPREENHATARAFADGLNDVVAHVMVNGSMTAEEIAYVLETFTSTFKFGFETPIPGI